MTKPIFQPLAAYNRCANARLYAAALDLSDQAYRLHIGVFFSSRHGTLNHLVLTDGIWLQRLTAEGDHPCGLKAILLQEISEARLLRRVDEHKFFLTVHSYDTRAS